MDKLKIEVDVDELFAMMRKIDYINSKALDQIVWKRDGEVIEIPEGDLEEFKFTGLGNTLFISLWLSDHWRFED